MHFLKYSYLVSLKENKVYSSWENSLNKNNFTNFKTSFIYLIEQKYCNLFFVV